MLILANRHYIRNLTIDGNNYGLLAKDFDNVVSMDFDYKEKMLYFADSGTQQRLYRLPVTNSGVADVSKAEVLLKHGIYGIEGLAVDWIGR